MKNTNKQTTPSVNSPLPKQLNYNEVVEYLDARWQPSKLDPSLSCIKELDKAFGLLSQKVPTVLIAGTNGKTLTAHFTSALLKEEGYTVGSFFSPHILNYNERFAINNEQIQNKSFTDLANEVIGKAEQLGLDPHALDVLTMMALVYFKEQNVDVALLEVSKGGRGQPASICVPKIAAITRITEDEISPWAKTIDQAIQEVLSLAKPGTHVISADQSKLNLQVMQKVAEQQESVWAMPIRKLSPLAYPYEQLHGRCAALAERIAYMFVNTFAPKEGKAALESLLMKQKGQRGRPTLEAKRNSELNPKKTLEQFWADIQAHIPGRFHILDKEKPTILLDNASNIDAFKNVLLGIRLLHYQRPLKGLTIILGCANSHLNNAEFLKMIRYFFKKTSGQIIVCPVKTIAGSQDDAVWNVDKITNDLKAMKLKAKAAVTFKEAYEMAVQTVDDRHGLMVITGSTSIVNEYWRYKGIKKV